MKGSVFSNGRLRQICRTALMVNHRCFLFLIPVVKCRYRHRGIVSLVAIVADPTSCSWCVQAELSHIRGERGVAWQIWSVHLYTTSLQLTSLSEVYSYLVYLYKYLYILISFVDGNIPHLQRHATLQRCLKKIYWAAKVHTLCPICSISSLKIQKQGSFLSCNLLKYEEISKFASTMKRWLT